MMDYQLPIRPEIYDSAAHTILFEAYFETLSRAEAEKSAIDAIFGLHSGFCRPMSVDLAVSNWDSEFDIPADGEPEDAHKLLLDTRLPENVIIDTLWVDQSITYTEEINREILSRFISESTDRSPKQAVDWDIVLVRASMARVSDFAAVTNASTEVLFQGRTLTYPIETYDGVNWICGPRRFMRHGPVEFKLSRIPGGISIEIEIYWSPLKPSGSEYAHVSGIASNLEAIGWSIV